MKKKKHILVISQYFYPEQFRINDICEEWVKRGYKVTVITGIPNYPEGKFYSGYSLFNKRKEIWNGINIVRIPIIPRGNNAIGLICNYMSFVVSGFFWNLFTKIRADIVFNYEVSPMTQALIGVWYAKKRKIPCYLYITDLWPDNVEIVTGIHNKVVINPINKMVNYIYKNCTRIFTSSNSFIKKLEERGVPSSKMHFWPQYAEEFYKPINTNQTLKEIPQDNIFNIIFAGNIGYAQGLEVLVKTALRLKKENQKVRFNIVGDGRYKNELIKNIKKHKVESYFNFIGKKPSQQIPLYMSKSDAALIPLSKSEVFSMTIPAKTQSCMACAKPILVVADGEVQDIIMKAQCGYVCDALDDQGLTKNIKKMLASDKKDLDIMGENARSYYETNYDKFKLIDKMDMYMEEDGSNDRI